MKHTLALASALLLILSFGTAPMAFAEEENGDDKKNDDVMSSGTFSGLKLRDIGPTINSGRVSDFAVNPEKRQHFYAATASGGLWKTVNAGTTWKPVFDNEDSYSIGCVVLDPSNPNVVWVGTGENNTQRSVSFGDGVYKSMDGGQTWKNMGLKASEHIGMITIDPRDTDVVYVAAQGPLWNSGGDRGLYKTTDGGENWEKILEISDDTGVNEVLMDPSNPDILYASSYQRARRVWTLVDGGPETAIYKSTDAGATWRKVKKGLPKEDMGKIGMCVPPTQPGTIYAVIEAARGKSGTFRSTDFGESWEKRSDYVSRSPQYYNELICDPVNPDRVYSMDTWMNVTEDGGKNFNPIGEKHKHVDNHALWIDPTDTDYLLVGCDGGVYESFDRGATWLYKENLPITQFYRVSVDNSTPFYYIYGGTQDNNSMGGPTRTLNSSGIAVEDWFITVGGDGYETVIDPVDPNILYSQWQYGGLVRYDRASGEIVDIQPQEEPGEAAHRWNWDSPVIISPHSPTRLYFACQRLYRSDDRGDTWRAVSGDLSRGLDTNQLEIMGKIWSIDSVAKNMSTSNYGSIIYIAESTLVEGLIYVGTDDGLIQVTENGGETWRKIDSFPGVPDMTYVSRVEASLHDADTVYAAFDNHKMGDFKPYVLVSRDRGATWTSIAGDLPEREIVYALMQDHEKPELLFAGTEFGLYFTVDEGKQWIRLKGGLPTIAVRDLEIQRRETDLAVGTFGRGFQILDDYSPLRHVSREALEGNDFMVFPVKDALLFIEKRSRQGSRGHGFFSAPNPDFGATFTYYVKEGFKTLKDIRKEEEKKAEKDGETVRIPTFEELRAEELEVEPEIVLIVRDADGNVVDRVKGKSGKGIHRTTWDLRTPSASPTNLKPRKNPWGDSRDRGPLVLPGSYSVTVAKKVAGEITELQPAVDFNVVPLDLATLKAEDMEAQKAFQAKTRRLHRAVRAALEVADEADSRIDHIIKALMDTPSADPQLMVEAETLRMAHADLMVELQGDRTRSRRNVNTPPSISQRVSRIRSDQWQTTQAPTTTHIQAYEWAADAFTDAMASLRMITDGLVVLEGQMEDAGAPWTPGRFPQWEKE